MSEENNEQKSFVVKDRRRFDSAGNERQDTDEAPKAAPKASESPKPQLPKSEAQSSGGGSSADLRGSPEMPVNSEVPEMNFSSFVMSLATQALMQLGEIKPPPGMEMEPDRNAARQSIDILGMLAEKTRNNLDKEEAHLLEQILHNLRLSYVKAVSK